jgi:hypothetical protein
MGILLACVETDVGSDADSGGDDIAWPEPELCEMRQQAPNGALEGPTDVLAVCDDANTWIAGLHRPQGVECTTEPMPIVACLAGGGETDECGSDADCQSIRPGSKCHTFGEGGDCTCVLPCTRDADCPEDLACVCRSGLELADGAINVVSHSACWPADCRGDDDCGLDARCVLTSPQLCPRYPHLECQPADSPCQSDLDCLENEACAGTMDGWQCITAGCGP